MNVPADSDVEHALLGACMLRSDAIEAASTILAPEDFYDHKAAVTFTAILDLWRNGEPVDARTVHARQHPTGLEANDLLACVAAAPSISHAEKYARIIADHAVCRKLIALGAEVSEAGWGNGGWDRFDLGERVDRLRASLDDIDLPIGRTPADLAPLDDLLDAPEADRSPWVVPGLLRADWRVVVVAPEGAGKTQTLHQVAICASQGIHPLTFEHIRPVRVLMVDLENPEDRLVHGCSPIRDQVRHRTEWDGTRLMLWHRPGGIDLRTRASAAELESVLTSVRPELVVMGPAYKASARYKGEGWDEGAAAVQRVLDGLRTRFGFALLMEDHAPQSSNGVRDLRPFGSSLWLRWPEIGLKLIPTTEPPAPRILDVRRWRGDRLPNGWPDQIHEDKPWPWVGKWNAGVPSYGEAA